MHLVQGPTPWLIPLHPQLGKRLLVQVLNGYGEGYGRAESTRRVYDAVL